MLNPEVRKKIDYLCKRIEEGAEVNLKDMIWLQKYAGSNTGVRERLRKAQLKGFRGGEEGNSLDNFCEEMGLGDPDPSTHLTQASSLDDIVEWFKQDKSEDWRQRD